MTVGQLKRVLSGMNDSTVLMAVKNKDGVQSAGREVRQIEFCKVSKDNDKKNDRLYLKFVFEER